MPGRREPITHRPQTLLPQARSATGREKLTVYNIIIIILFLILKAVILYKIESNTVNQGEECAKSFFFRFV